MLCSADYYLVTCSQRRLVCADVCSAQNSRRYQNRKCTAPSQFGIVGAANWQRRLVRAEHTSAHTITTVTHSQRRIVGAANVGSTDQAALQMFTKEQFRAFFMGDLFRGEVRQGVPAAYSIKHLVYHRVYRESLRISEQKIQAPLSNHTHAIFRKFSTAEHSTER